MQLITPILFFDNRGYDLMGKHQDICGQKFWRLTAIEYAGDGLWFCNCECGKTTKASPAALRAGRNKSCGCWNREQHTKSGLVDHPLYRVWVTMRARCNNPNDASYHNYGGRGIKVCERWDNFSNFLSDRGERPQRCDIDRIDNNGNYDPENCRWVSRKENLRNTRRTRMLTFQGEALPVGVWSERLGVPVRTLLNRIDRGWSVENALTLERHARGRRKSQLHP